MFAVLAADAVRSFTPPFELRADNSDPTCGTPHVIATLVGDAPPDPARLTLV